MQAYLLELKGYHEDDTRTHNLLKRVNVRDYNDLQILVRNNNLFPILKTLPIQTTFRPGVGDVQLQGHTTIIIGSYPHSDPNDWQNQVNHVKIITEREPYKP